MFGVVGMKNEIWNEDHEIIKDATKALFINPNINHENIENQESEHNTLRSVYIRENEKLWKKKDGKTLLWHAADLNILEVIEKAVIDCDAIDIERKNLKHNPNSYTVEGKPFKKSFLHRICKRGDLTTFKLVTQFILDKHYNMRRKNIKKFINSKLTTPEGPELESLLHIDNFWKKWFFKGLTDDRNEVPPIAGATGLVFEFLLQKSEFFEIIESYCNIKFNINISNFFPQI